MKILALMIGCIAAVMVLTGCARTQAIKDLEQDKVIVVETGDLRSLPEDLDRLAREGCSLHGRIAVPISTITSTNLNRLSGYEYEHLYACIESENAD